MDRQRKRDLDISADLPDRAGKNASEFHEVRLGLRENLGQFSLLVVVNAFVGAMVVTARRDGTRIFYKISSSKIIKACLIMRDVMFEQMKKKINIIKNAEGYEKDKGRVMA